MDLRGVYAPSCRLLLRGRLDIQRMTARSVLVGLGGVLSAYAGVTVKEVT